MNKFFKVGLSILILLNSMNSYSNWVGTGLKFGEPKIQKSFKQKEKKITFEPNPLNELTLSFIGPQYSFGLQFTAEKDDDGEFIDSQYSDFIISFYTNSYIVDLYFSEFSDLYILEDKDEINANKLDDTISGNSIGARTLFYLDGTNIQENYGEYVLSPKTGVGMFYDFSVEHSTLNSENELIPLKYRSYFDKLSNVKRVTMDSIETLVGGSYLHAWDSIFINTYLKIGPSFDSQVLEDGETKSTLLISSTGETFLGISYYDQQLQAGIRAKFRQTLSQINGVEYKDTLGVGYAYILILF